MTTITLLEAVTISDTIVTILTPQRNLGIPQELKEKGEYGITSIGGKLSYWLQRNGDRLLPIVKEYLQETDSLTKAFRSLPEVVEITELQKVKTDEMKPDDKKAHMEKLSALDKKCQELYEINMGEQKVVNEREVEVDFFPIDYELLDSLNYNPTFYPNMNLIMKYIIVKNE